MLNFYEHTVRDKLTQCRRRYARYVPVLHFSAFLMSALLLIVLSIGLSRPESTWLCVMLYLMVTLLVVLGLYLLVIFTSCVLSASILSTNERVQSDVHALVRFLQDVEAHANFRMFKTLVNHLMDAPNQVFPRFLCSLFDELQTFTLDVIQYDMQFKGALRLPFNFFRH